MLKRVHEELLSGNPTGFIGTIDDILLVGIQKRGGLNKDICLEIHQHDETAYNTHLCITNGDMPIIVGDMLYLLTGQPAEGVMQQSRVLAVYEKGEIKLWDNFYKFLTRKKWIPETTWKAIKCFGSTMIRYGNSNLSDKDRGSMNPVILIDTGLAPGIQAESSRLRVTLRSPAEKIVYLERGRVVEHPEATPKPKYELIDNLILKDGVIAYNGIILGMAVLKDAIHAIQETRGNYRLVKLVE